MPRGARLSASGSRGRTGSGKQSDKQSDKRSDKRSDKKQAALIATAVTVPVVVILALLFSALGASSGSSNQTGPLPALSLSAPPNIKAETTPCTALLSALPIQLEGLAPRVVNTTPSTPFVVAWGDPAIIVRCGVDKPKGFGAGSAATLITGGTDAGALYYVGADGDSQVYTAVDRQALVSFSIPGKYPGGNYLPVLNRYLLQAMPRPFCSTNPDEPDPDKLCTRRSN